ncbi:thioviridamide family RiPP peptide [Streptomyces sp. NPDC059452]|uniref:thioviridamide family RiPP peptide n=1 Tax=Streptomyces sp. NPDC059452 TaxID=3346835 RepID=UPI00369A6620
MSIIDEQQIAELAEQVNNSEAQDIDLSAIDSEFQEIAGLSPEDLQAFLEDKMNVSAEEGVQGTIGSVIVTPATHC